MTAAITIAIMTARQTLGLKRFVGLGLLAASPAGIFLLASGQSSTDGLIDIFVALTIGVFFSVAVPVTALIMAGSALGDERRDGTLSFIVLRPISREVIAGAKLGGALATAFALSGLGAAAMGILMAIRGGGWSLLLPILVGAFVATVAYVALFLPLGYLTERATLIGLGFVFIWETAVAGTIPGLATTSPWRLGYSAFVALAPRSVLRGTGDFALGNITPGAGGALLKVVVLALVSTAVTAWLLRTRDLT